MPASLDLLTPWLALAATLLPLLYLEQWIHQHLFGVGWLLTRDDERATFFYYVILLPGVFLHEFTQWLTAGALQVKTSRITIWPKKQKNGTLRFDFVKLRKTSGLRAAIIGIVPLASGIGIVLFISQHVFGTAGLAEALATGDLPIIQAALGQLFSTPDFWLWLYLLFAIGNAMIPTPADRQGWPLVAGIFGAVAVFFLVLGLGEEILIPALAGPITNALNTLVAGFGAVLVLDCFVVIVLGLLERGLERLRGEKVKYRKKSKRPAKPKPGGEVPLPADMAPPRIAERPLPIPPAPRKPRKPPQPELPDPEAQPGPSGLPSGRTSYLERFQRPVLTSDSDETIRETGPQVAVYTPEDDMSGPVEDNYDDYEPGDDYPTTGYLADEPDDNAVTGETPMALTNDTPDVFDDEPVYEPLDEETPYTAGGDYQSTTVDDTALADDEDDELRYVPLDDV